MAEDGDRWRRTAARQDGMITRQQLAEAGVTRAIVTRRSTTGRWRVVAPTVIATFTGHLSAEQLLWRALLHAGRGALLGGITAAEQAGLRHWRRDTITVLVPYSRGSLTPLKGVAYQRTRRSLDGLRQPGAPIRRCRLEPAALLFASCERDSRTARGLLAATVQQGLTTSDALIEWIDRLAPLRRSALLHETVLEIAGGAQSVGEMDIQKMCKAYKIAKPLRQVRRRDRAGRLRFTDCEWRLSSGRALILEIDGAFHMDIEHWEADLARQRALSASDRTIVRCTTRELRDEPHRVARDLKALGVPEL